MSVSPARGPVIVWLAAPPSDHDAKLKRLRPSPESCGPTNAIVWLQPSSARSVKAGYVSPSNWILGRGWLPRTPQSPPKRSRKDIVRSVTSWRMESTPKPANVWSAFLSAAGVVRNTRAVLALGPAYRSAASPRLEQPANDGTPQKFPDTGCASRLPNASAWTTARRCGNPDCRSLLNKPCAIFAEST